jgi:CHAT domain-containing protein/tetratricopeptide (TPR) repeat protein
MGDLESARRSLEQGLALRQRELGPHDLNTAHSLNCLGGALQWLGDLAGARRHFEQALTIRQTMLGEEHPDTANTLSNLSYVLQSQGHLAQARTLCERALAIREKTLGPDHPDTAHSLNTLVTLLWDQGDYAGARPCCERALAITERVLGPDHPDTAVSLNNLGSLLREMGDLAEARPRLEHALAIRERKLGPDHPDTAQSLTNLGALDEAVGSLAEARSCYERALTIDRRALGEDHPLTASSLNNLGVLLKKTGDLAGARPYLELALASRRRVLGEDHPDTAQSLTNLGILLVALGQQGQALPLMRQAAFLDERLIGQVFAIGSERQRAAILAQTQDNLAAFLSLVWGYLSQSDETVRLALDLVLRRKALQAEAQAVQRDAVLGGRYPHLQETLRRWSALRLQIARKSLAGPGPEGPDAHRQQLEVWNTQRQRLEEELARQIPEMNLEQKLRAADRRAVALALPTATTLVEFVRFGVFNFKAVPARGERRWQPARYLAFLLCPGDPDNVRMIDLGGAEPIDALIEVFRAGVGELPAARNMARRPAPASPLTPEQVGQQLRSAVFDPLLAALGDCRRLLVSPDGGLTQLPFAVLPNSAGGLLLDAYQISCVNCGRDVLRFGTTSSMKPSAAVVVTDPDFDLAASAPARAATERGDNHVSRDLPRDRLHFGRLAGTRAEGEVLASLLGVPCWQDSAALEGRLKRECVSPRILHLATHGFFLQDQQDSDQQRRGRGALGPSGCEGRLSGPLPENPLLRSGLALAGANTWLRGGTPPEEAEDGLLTAEDVSGLDLLATELVVLSACETGLGEVRTGEGVFGLQRAFTLAGARTLVMSLWSVPDEATRELMEDFYKRILAGEGRADALRNAQLALRKKYPDPYFWGAFICQGDPAPLREPARPAPGQSS